MIVFVSIAANRRTFPRLAKLPSQICHVFSPFALCLPHPQMGEGQHELQIVNFVFIFIVLLLPKNSVTCRAVCAVHKTSTSIGTWHSK